MGFLYPFIKPVQREGQSKGRGEEMRKTVMVIINSILLLSISYGRYEYTLPWQKRNNRVQHSFQFAPQIVL